MRRLTGVYRYYIERFVWFRSEKYSIHELMFYYTLLITVLITGMSLITNPLFGLPFSATMFSLFAVFFTPFIFWLDYAKGKTLWARNIFLVFFVLMINGVWMFSGGSQGTALVMTQGFLLLYLFFSVNTYYHWVLVFLLFNIIGLFAIELYWPHLIESYPSNRSRLLDVLFITVIFFVFELPVIAYAKRVLLRDKQEAVKSDAAKTSFVVNLSHEIRTPMNAILGFAELLEDGTLEPEVRNSYIRIINENGRNLLTLLNNVISFSKIEANQSPVTAAWLSVDALFHQVQASLLHQIQSNPRVQFRLSLPDDALEIYTDSLMAYQILNNLAYNALKFTTQGEVEMGCQQEGDQVLFYVRDTGIGIAPEAIDQIFERFHHAGGTVREHAQHGAGLGLAICRGLTSLLQGRMWVESMPNSGSTFYVQLPIRYEPLKNSSLSV
ncbi:phospho-acceptor domain-containing protein [Breznakibacter xylanolyticus]|uniref:histidine kinase n=1 Tax=Breznakibacter xylanolyticus TaxID=990 RepID=A0A2W7N1E8_9BACT|nr:ATP-binding protein [Breznakibacter xylanolyticus]PZX13811.1 phospho-acceptor domain-containing protein [Breznakibacter xylanolyticus]